MIYETGKSGKIFMIYLDSVENFFSCNISNFTKAEIQSNQSFVFAKTNSNKLATLVPELSAAEAQIFEGYLVDECSSKSFTSFFLNSIIAKV